MKNIILVLTFSLFALAITFAENSNDTTITANLPTNDGSVKVVMNYNDTNMSYELTLGKSKINGRFQEALLVEMQVLDIDADDGNSELAVMGIGASDFNEVFFYEYSGGNIIPCGHIDYTTGLNTEGNKILKSTSWMGFWTLTEDYYFDSKAKTLTKKPKVTYPVKDAAGKVTQSFNLLKDRKDNSDIVATLKTGTKITVVKSDISPVCKDKDGNDESWLCFWYFIKASDGSEGWVRMKDFQEKVEGLNWAG